MNEFDRVWLTNDGWGVARRAAQVKQAALGEHDDAVAVGEPRRQGADGNEDGVKVSTRVDRLRLDPSPLRRQRDEACRADQS